MVEFQPSKLAVVGSNPIARSILEDVKGETSRGRNGQSVVHLSRMTFYEAVAHVAQLAEHVLGKDEVTRSIRVVGSRLCLPIPPVSLESFL